MREKSILKISNLVAVATAALDCAFDVRVPVYFVVPATGEIYSISKKVVATRLQILLDGVALFTLLAHVKPMCASVCVCLRKRMCA